VNAPSAAPLRSTDDSIAGVVLLHGIARTSRSLNKVESALRQAGFATLNLDYASRRKPIEALAEEIHPPIAAFAKLHDAPIHFVAHSMGGLLARRYLAIHRPPGLGRVVMLGTPNAGSEVADLLRGLSLYRAIYGPAGLQLTTHQPSVLAGLPPPDYDVGIIAGCRSIAPTASLLVLPRPNDGRVSVASSKLANMADHIIVKASHTGLPRHPDAIAQTIAFLQAGKFKSPSQGTHSLTP
jgi:pimeloyl-ACP methyl ester carboxylesterase